MSHQSKKNTTANAAHQRARRLLPGTLLICLSVTACMAQADVKVFSDDKGDSISLFGIIDNGILVQSRSVKSNGSEGGTQTSSATSGLRQSVWGIKGGTGDLGIGDNTKAFFNLESHFDTTTGQLHGTGDANQSNAILFRRQANLGLNGDWGTLILGRQYGPALLAHLDTEPRYFKENFSNLYAWAYGQINGGVINPSGGNARSSNNDVGIFFSNAIQYRNNFGPVTVGALYSFGGQPGNFNNNSAWSLGAEYKGPVIVSASYDEMKDALTGEVVVEHGGLGFAVPYGDFTFKTLLLNAKNRDSLGNTMADVNADGIGMDWHWRPNNTATVAYYSNRNKTTSGDTTHNLVISNDWAINSWVTFYSTLTLVDAGAQAGLLTSIVAGANYPVNAKTTFLNVGLNLAF